VSMDAKTYFHEIAVKSEQVSPIRIAGFKRHDLIKRFDMVGYKTGAEIGVAEGKFSEIMCKKIQGLNLYCIDPWVQIKDNKRSMDIGRNLAEQRYKEATERLKGFKTELIRKTSLDAVSAFIPGHFDFVYIDGAHNFDYVMTDIIEWSKRVRSGGIVAGHDYYRFRNAGVVQAVDIYTYMHKIDEWFITDERTPTWFWVKE